MSILSNAAIIGGVNVLQTVLFKQGRSIAGIIPNVVVDEQHVDELTITSHPVEQGAAITDHAFKNPAQVTVRYGFGESGGLLSFTGAGGDPRAIYNQLLQLQASRVPFDLVTGKRQYRNMLIQTLGATTDQATENVLMVTVTMKEIITVRTETTTLQPSQMHAMPEKTAPLQNTGVKQPQLRSASISYRVVDGTLQIFGFRGLD
jgi:hypothetical protein